METGTLSRISESLPEGFPFYSFGEVFRLAEKTGEPSERILEAAELDGKIGISFKLLGEPQALLIILFEPGVDVSMYSELGNILASKLCQKLSERGEGDLMITPPLPLGPTQLARLARAGIPCIRRSYRHVVGERTVWLETLILPIFQAGGDLGHA